MKYLLDTHIWIWWHNEPQKIPDSAFELIRTPGENELLLSTISLWEFCKLIEKSKIAISCNPLDWLNKAILMSSLRIVPISVNIAYRSTILSQPFHNDPADQIIVATALEESATVITSDRRIINYEKIPTLS